MELCKHLSYSRSLSPGKAVFFYKTADSDFVPLRVETARVVGQKSGYSEGFDANFQPKNVERYELRMGILKPSKPVMFRRISMNCTVASRYVLRPIRSVQISARILAW